MFVKSVVECNRPDEVILKRTLVDDGYSLFNNLSVGHHQSQVKSKSNLIGQFCRGVLGCESSSVVIGRF